MTTSRIGRAGDGSSDPGSGKIYLFSKVSRLAGAKAGSISIGIKGSFLRDKAIVV
jgi:hypothetical protein